MFRFSFYTPLKVRCTIKIGYLYLGSGLLLFHKNWFFSFSGFLFQVQVHPLLYNVYVYQIITSHLSNLNIVFTFEYLKYI